LQFAYVTTLILIGSPGIFVKLKIIQMRLLPANKFSAVLFLATTFAAAGASQIDSANPICFFTNVASKLLSSQLNVDLTRIEVYPTNQYTPAVNRLLQLTANIYDATTTNFYPTIFRPMFTHDVNGNVFIAGYAQQTNLINQLDEMNPWLTPDLATPIEAADFDNLVPADIEVLTNIYDVPWIIGAKKGFPNFNEFASENVFELTRKLEVVRDWNNPNQPDITWTNQMYLFNFTNYLGLEFWNSYRSNYLGAGTNNPGAVDIAFRSYLTMALTNDDPNFWTYYSATTNWFIIETNLWHGWNGIIGQPQNPGPFVTWMTNVNFFANTVAYYYNRPNPSAPSGNPYFYYPDNYETNFTDQGIRELPHFGLLATNHLQAAIIDYSAGADKGRIIDYIQLGGLQNVRDLNAEIQANDKDGMFNTNYDAQGNLLGVFQQIYLSAHGTFFGGGSPTGPGVWRDAPIPGGPKNYSDPVAQQAFFNAIFSRDGIYVYAGIYYSNTQTSVQAPYTPSVFGIQYQTWQANDPLVHYLASDLTSLNMGAGLKQTVGWPENIGSVNDRYQPWGKIGTSIVGTDVNPYNSSYKDPLVLSSDNWNFPTNQSLNANWLGQIHRGTPWQTIYLKSTNILDWTNHFGGSGITTWLQWTGDGNLSDATNMAPVRDWQIAALLAEMFNTNNLSSLFSINNPDPNAWRGLLDGLTALTNDVSNTRIRFLPAHFTTITISSNSSQASLIANAIESARMTRPNQLFTNVPEIFSITPMIEQSPYLNLNGAQLTNGISDAAYEIIPSQLLPLLRADSIGSIIPANGQTVIQFSGYDGYCYLIQTSSDLLNWTTVSTNSPVNGIFTFTNSSPASSQFYRSILLN
jgi:hypothetical protein